MKSKRSSTAKRLSESNNSAEKLVELGKKNLLWKASITCNSPRQKQYSKTYFDCNWK